MMGPQPPSLDAAELYSLALRFIAISGLYSSQDLRWAKDYLLQTCRSDPAETKFAEDVAAFLERMAVIDDEFQARRAAK